MKLKELDSILLVTHLVLVELRKFHRRWQWKMPLSCGGCEVGQVKKQADCSVGREIEYERINFCPEAMFLEHNIVAIDSGIAASAT